MFQAGPSSLAYHNGDQSYVIPTQGRHIRRTGGGVGGGGGGQ